jgi:hypothetical protein
MSTTTETKTIKPQEEFQRLLPDAIANACFSVTFSLDVMEEYRKKATEISNSAKEYGQQYSSDNEQLVERFINGHLAQVAIEKQLGVKFTQWKSTKPDGTADMLPVGLKIGIKSFKVSEKNAPMIPRIIKYPEIIVAIDGLDKNIFHCLGIFKPRDLKEKDFICDSLIKTKSALERKTGFYRIDKGTPFNTLDQLKNIVGPLWTI